MLTIRNLNAYYGQGRVLKDISLHVDEGGVAVMLGPNGHGKSTLLKSICGLMDKLNGEILYKGENIAGTPAEKLVEKGIVYIAETRELFPLMTVLENLKMGAFVKNARKYEKKNLKKVFELFPRLLERKKQIASTLSGGEARMLAIARGLMSSADFICIDEPSLGLQPNLRMEVFNIIREINRRGKTLFVVEQNIPQVAELADRIYLLEEGRITFESGSDDAVGQERLKEIFLGM